MDYLRIHNWDKWQSYRSDRGQPPWIKVHREVLRHIEWVAMNDVERGQLVSIWLLAADHNGVVPASPEIIQKLCFLTNQPDIERLISLGFIDKKPVKRDQISQPDDDLASQERQPDQPEKSRVDKRRVEKNIFVEDSDEFRLSALLFQKMLENNPKAKAPNLQSWAKHVDLMIRIDKRPHSEIESVIEWCQRDNFWRSNILSTAKLREKYDQLSLIMNPNNNSKGGKHGQPIQRNTAENRAMSTRQYHE